MSENRPARSGATGCEGTCTCGGPDRDDFGLAHRSPRLTPVAVHTSIDAGKRHLIVQRSIPAGTFLMGDSRGRNNPGDGELPLHQVTLADFDIDATAVTVGAFRRFVQATGYVTDAERFGFSAVFHLTLDAAPEDVLGRPSGTPWWLGVRGADWKHPCGPRSSTSGLEEHPVTHVSWNDAAAYCAWANRRLPTEAEWEYSSRGGLAHATYPWGDNPPDDGGWRANIWQGNFPLTNTLQDGYLTTAPVRSYEPNGYGLWQTVGNVWEWCADWYANDYYQHSPLHRPTGPDSGTSKVMRGGSFLCHDSYCNRYRNSARTSNTPDSSAANTGFRTVSVTLEDSGDAPTTGRHTLHQQRSSVERA